MMPKRSAALPKAWKGASSKVDTFVYSKGRLSQPVLNPQQFQRSAEFRQRKTLNVGTGSTKIHYNLRGAFSITTSIGPHAHASTAQGGRTRVSRSAAGFYQRKTR